MSDNPEAWLEQVAGSGPVIVVAPHGGRRHREVRPDDSVIEVIVWSHNLKTATHLFKPST